MKKTFIYAALVTVTFSCKPLKNEDNGAAAGNTVDAPSGQVAPEKTVPGPKVYRATETQLTDLVHTKLEVSFDWNNSQMKGRETLTAKPHFYKSNELILDAQSMDILSVKLNDKPLKFAYTNDTLTIQLDKTYGRDEQYTVVIDYVAKPEERTAGGSAAITSDKGLYFINPRCAEGTKMPQIWTQGETQSNSVWFPTIDSPNAKSTQEIFITVEDKYVTLSNGTMIGSKKNADGTRTDHWKQDLPHSVYLFMMGVGEFKIVKDTYMRPNGKPMEVNYYVEPEWEKYARSIFGETPAMIAFFSKLTGVEYPWDKYSQIVVRDYVSGAMENTGAVVFGDFVYKTDRDLLDANDNSTIAHELFHHWFGDLVTAESWSNLTLNESFANYSQYLWDEHRYGLDEADYNAIQEAEGYYASAQQGGYHDLVWFEYDNREQMFDGHSYNKGGRILHMLRNYLGDEAFFQGIKTYLSENAYKPAEFHQLRIAFEKVCGEDLNWFFNQWYLASGHPSLTIKHSTANGKAVIDVSQTQDFKKFPLFRLPVDVTVYDDKGATVHRIWVDKAENHFEFPYSGTLKNVLFDSQQMLLARKNEKKDAAMYVHQFYNVKKYEARRDGLLNAIKGNAPEANKMILDAMNDPFFDIRVTAYEKFSRVQGIEKETGLQMAKKAVKEDPNSLVRAAALGVLSVQLKGDELKAALEDRIANDKSYTVITKALNELTKVDGTRAMTVAKQLEKEESPKMLAGVARIYGTNGTPENYAFFEQLLLSDKLSGFDAVGALNSFTLYVSKQDLPTIRKALQVYDHESKSGDMYMKMFLPQLIDYITKAIDQKAKDNTSLKAEAEALIADYKKIAASAEIHEAGH